MLQRHAAATIPHTVDHASWKLRLTMAVNFHAALGLMQMASRGSNLITARPDALLFLCLIRMFVQAAEAPRESRAPVQGIRQGSKRAAAFI